MNSNNVLTHYLVLGTPWKKNKQKILMETFSIENSTEHHSKNICKIELKCGFQIRNPHFVLLLKSHF